MIIQKYMHHILLNVSLEHTLPGHFPTKLFEETNQIWNPVANLTQKRGGPRLTSHKKSETQLKGDNSTTYKMGPKTPDLFFLGETEVITPIFAG